MIYVELLEIFAFNTLRHKRSRVKSFNCREEQKLRVRKENIFIFTWNHFATNTACHGGIWLCDLSLVVMKMFYF